jgi:flagellin-like hook-associated protein FlgL
MSNIIHTDYAIETSNLAKKQRMQSASIAALAQAKDISRAIVDLI